MKLQTRFLVTGGCIRVCILTGLLLLTYLSDHWALSFVALSVAAVWVTCAAWLNHHLFLPLIVRHVRCYHCRYHISLIQYWGVAGSEHRDHRRQHVLKYHDPKGREISSFQCPRKECSIKPTIQVQKGIDAKVVRGQILGDATTVAPDAKPMSLWRTLTQDAPAIPEGMPIGTNRSVRYGRVHQLVLKLRTRPPRPPVVIGEEGYGCSMNIFGKSGKGKSTLMQTQAQWVFESGHGATFIDPHGDLTSDLLTLVPEHRKDDVILIRVSDQENIVGCNVLEAHSELEAMNLKTEVKLAIKKLADSWGSNIDSDIDDGLETGMRVGGTLKDVYDMFAKPSVREECVRRLDPIDDEELIAFWDNYDRRRESAKGSVKNKLRDIVNHPLLGPMVSSPHSLNPDSIIRDRKIVLADLSTGGMSDDVNEMFGTILFIKMVAAAFRQLSIDEQDRVRHFLFVDEAGSFMHKGMDFGKVYSQARKMKLSLVLACQHMSQLTENVTDNMWGNAGVILSFCVDGKDAKEFVPRFPGTSVTEFTRQKKGECIACVNETSVHRIRTQFPQRAAKDQTAYIEERMRKLNPITPEAKKPEKKRSHTIDPFEGLTPTSLQVCEGVQ